MECALRLTEDDITYLINFLIAGGLGGSSPSNPTSSDEPGITRSIRESVNEYRPLVQVFGDSYADVVENARSHVKDCGACNRLYREELLAVAGMIDISKRGSEGSDDAGSLEEDLRELDGEWLGILYDD